MADESTIAIEATDPKYFGLKHMPGRFPLDANGKGVWPADQFTFRLIEEGAVRHQNGGALASAAPPSLPAPGSSAKSTKPAASAAKA